MLLVEIAVSNAKFHSNQDKTSQSIAMNVFQTINHKTEVVQVAEDLAVEVAAEVAQVAADLAAEVALAEEVTLIEDHEKCTKQLVEIVRKNVKFHSNQEETSQSIAVSVFKIIKETRKYTSILDKINPIRTYYVERLY
jgi:thioredoxin-like negative regulator of GroEL